jgi:hypothetical protein
MAALKPAAVVWRRSKACCRWNLLFPSDPNRVRPAQETGRRWPTAGRLETLLLTSEQLVSLARLQRTIGLLAPKLARAKGFCETTEEPGQNMLLQFVGGRAALSHAPLPPHGVPRVRNVFIAEIGVLSMAEIAQVMETCASPAMQAAGSRLPL